MISKTKHQLFLRDAFQKLVQRWQKCIEVLVILWEKNYTALKITDVDIFLFFYFTKISFSPVSFSTEVEAKLISLPS